MNDAAETTPPRRMQGADRRGPALSIHGVSRFAAQNVLLVGLIGLSIFFGFKSPQFWTLTNIRSIGLTSAVLAIVAVAEALLILSGYVDLSIGSVLGLGGVVAGLLTVNHHAAPVIAVGVALLVGAGIGAVNGWLCTYLGLSPLLVTLGALTAVRGATLLVTSLPVFGFGTAFDSLGVGTIAGIPVPVVIAAAIFAIGALYLGLTPGGRHVYAIGVNPEAAYLSGIQIKRLPFTLFVLCGAAAALGGVLFAARLDSAPPGTLGVGFELSVLTAVLLGGVAFEGGRGNMIGVLLGVLFLGVLQNGLTLLNVTDFWQQVANGVALVVAAGLSVLSTRASGALGGGRKNRTEVGSTPSLADNTFGSGAMDPASSVTTVGGATTNG
ncbi:MAG: ptative permease component of transporter [Frankiales bacterium]|nr:ptative permease component of transporter [Frankiales bacterium]